MINYKVLLRGYVDGFLSRVDPHYKHEQIRPDLTYMMEVVIRDLKYISEELKGDE